MLTCLGQEFDTLKVLPFRLHLIFGNIGLVPLFSILQEFLYPSVGLRGKLAESMVDDPAATEGEEQLGTGRAKPEPKSERLPPAESKERGGKERAAPPPIRRRVRRPCRPPPPQAALLSRPHPPSPDRQQGAR